VWIQALIDIVKVQMSQRLDPLPCSQFAELLRRLRGVELPSCFTPDSCLIVFVILELETQCPPECIESRKDNMCSERTQLSPWCQEPKLDQRSYWCWRCGALKALKGQIRQRVVGTLKPKLQPEDVAHVKHLWSSDSPSDTTHLGVAFNIPMLRSTFSTLQPGAWINDDIINMTMQILEELHHSANKKPDLIFTSFFYFLLAERDGRYNYEAVKRDTKLKNWIGMMKMTEEDQRQQHGKKWVNIFTDIDKVFIPINKSNNHWYLAVVFMSEKVVRFYDSISGSKTKVFQDICQWLRDEGLKLEIPAAFFEGWSSETPTAPKQRNGIDCGVFTLVAAELVMLGAPMVHDQAMMGVLRLRYAIAILRRCKYIL
jgi:hypothetical protein